MKIYRLFLLCFFTILLIPLESEAQRDVYDWQLTPYAGLLTINNDIAFPKNANTYAYGLRAERRLGNAFTLGLHIAHLEVGDDQVRDNITGGFLSLGYNWDNGYLLSQRSFLSVFHRLDIGYADRYSTFESIGGTTADLAVGFENGFKLRFGDRISAEVSLELFSSKTNLTSGDITKNIRYNVWKAGITYHFGSRKSNYVAPVFVPRTSIPAQLDKIETKEDNIWVANDSIYNRKVKIESVDTNKAGDTMIPQLTRADSMLIFMHFDSLYQRKVVKDTLISLPDSVVVDTLRMDSIPAQKIDSLKTSAVYISPLDSSQYVDSSEMLLSADSLRSDSLRGVKRTTVDSSVIVSRAVSDTVVILKTDTVYMERPKSETFDQKSDSTEQTNIINSGQGRVDTLYIVKDAADTRGKSGDGGREAVKGSQTATTTSAQDAKISSLESEIDRLKKDNKRSNTGKVVAAGAAGAVLGSVLSKDRKSEKDTVFVVNTEDTSRIDSLQHELDSLKRMYGINDSLGVGTSGSVVNPPIGMYFAKGDSTTALLPDSSYALQRDSLDMKLDTLAAKDVVVLNGADNEPRTDSLHNSETTVVPVGIAKTDTSASAPTGSADEPQKESEPADQKSIPALMGKYPVSCNFGLNKTTLDKEELEKIDVVIDDLKNGEKRKASLTGYTDKSGNADYNLQLSKKRANSVREYLVSKGIAANRIKVNAGGVLSSAEKYSPDARRVEVRIEE